MTDEPPPLIDEKDEPALADEPPPLVDEKDEGDLTQEEAIQRLFFYGRHYGMRSVMPFARFRFPVISASTCTPRDDPPFIDDNIFAGIQGTRGHAAPDFGED